MVQRFRFLITAVMETDIIGEHLNSISFNRIISAPVCLAYSETNLERGRFPSFPITETPSFCVIDTD